MRWLAIVALVLSPTAIGCAGPRPPAHWVSGGGRLDLVNARWVYNGEPVEIRSRGDSAEITVDNDVEIVLDRVGRVYDRYQIPVAVLEPDGRLVGKGEELLGVIGSSYAALPGRANAWLAISPQGMVVKYEPDGSQKAVGQWFGCGVTPFSQQACLLVSYLLFFEDEGSAAIEATPAMGVGVGVGAVPTFGP